MSSENKIDKEAIKKIAEIICGYAYGDTHFQELPSSARKDTSETASKVISELKELGYHKLPKETLTREDVEPILIKHFDKGTGTLDFMGFAREILDKYGGK